MTDTPSIHLLQQWRDGDQLAAQEIFDRYVERLVALARSRLPTKMQRRVEPEDVVQSVYRSFFRVAAQDRYNCQQSGDLWRLLATVTVNKVRHQLKFHTAQKRSLKNEDSLVQERDASSAPMPDPSADEPTPDEAVALLEEVEFALSGLDPLHREIMELRLQGLDTEYIAAKVQRTERTVRRVLEKVQSQLEQRLLESSQ